MSNNFNLQLFARITGPTTDTDARTVMESLVPGIGLETSCEYEGSSQLPVGMAHIDKVKYLGGVPADNVFIQVHRFTISTGKRMAIKFHSFFLYITLIALRLPQYSLPDIMDTPEGLRLRLMTFLSLYDLLPYSISNPPNGTAPLTLEEAIGPEAVRRCLEVISRQHSSSMPAELSNILRNYSRTGTNSTSSGSSRSHPTHGQTSPGNNRSPYYANCSPSSSSQSPYLRKSY
ncbi:hypothetical protein GALMADRAFT_159390 [Galerina marginata CBS 339.88]|uniref:Uncharacterized protein n=1 Tax=Galerina marginata (strain CBS 339.88) TaxID=685588 RepID=A0A067SXS1_GALM3|nr:hypothetical protein GALMADRAFT_159390 [Galerina marginata CBS 339.88]